MDILKLGELETFKDLFDYISSEDVNDDDIKDDYKELDDAWINALSLDQLIGGLVTEEDMNQGGIVPATGTIVTDATFADAHTEVLPPHDINEGERDDAAHNKSFDGQEKDKDELGRREKNKKETRSSCRRREGTGTHHSETERLTRKKTFTNRKDNKVLTLRKSATKAKSAEPRKTQQKDRNTSKIKCRAENGKAKVRKQFKVQVAFKQSKVEQFQCDTCEYSSNRKYNLKIHR